MIKITVLLDHELSRNKGLAATHGLSFYLQKGETKIMFDFGPGREAWENGRKLNIPFEEIRYGVFSHSHYDHGCGFFHAPEYGCFPSAVLGDPAFFFQEKYSAGPGGIYTYMGCGFSKEYVSAHTRQQLICSSMIKLEEGCWALGNFERKCSWEKIPPKYVRETAFGKMKPDLFEDEICLVLELENTENTPPGLALIAGCSHPGIVNMVNTAKRILGRPVLAVIGGLHLSKSEPERLHQTARELKGAGVVFAAPSHCSGRETGHIFAEYGINVCYPAAGDCLYL